MKSLAKRREDRYQSAAAMRSDIERYLAGRPVHAAAVPLSSATTVIPPIDPPADATTVRPAVPPPDEDENRGRTGLYIALGLLLVLLIAGAAYLLPRLFEQPPQQVQVPNLIGLTEKQARSAIGDAGLGVGKIDFQADQDVAKNKVISQDPNRDQYVDPDTRINFVVSTGKPLATVPSVVGEDMNDATATL